MLDNPFGVIEEVDKNISENQLDESLIELECKFSPCPTRK